MYILCATASAFLVAATALGCASSAEPEPGARSQAIVAGDLDTAHQAVVAYLQGGKCGATIVEVKGSTGYAVTAAHCIGGTLGVLRQGDNHANGIFDVEYPVIATAVHPLYAESGLFDVAVLTFSGATAQTPVIQPLSVALDDLAAGVDLTLVGYGDTENGGTTVRHQLSLPINFVTAMRVNFDQMNGGMCSGDSGGAAIRHIGDTDYLAGVNSFIGGDCYTSGTAIRVSAVYESFILPTINGTPVEDPTCGQCSDAHIFNGKCTSALSACYDDADCSAYMSCVQGCSTQACTNECGITESAGFALHKQIDDCVCSTACATECAGDDLCAPEPSCWLTSADDSCQTCFEAACCAEATACATDDDCQSCFDGASSGMVCDGNSELETLTACLQDSCATECGLPPDDTHPDAGPGDDVDAGPQDGGGCGGCATTAPFGGAGMLLLVALCLAVRRGRSTKSS